jgi:hypothetical protein
MGYGRLDSIHGSYSIPGIDFPHNMSKNTSSDTHNDDIAHASYIHRPL